MGSQDGEEKPEKAAKFQWAVCRWEERLRVRGGGRAREGQAESSKRSGEGLLEEVGLGTRQTGRG